MKKTLLTLATLAISTTAMTATNTTTKTVGASALDRALEGTAASIAAGFERTNQDVNASSAYLNITGSKQITEDLNLAAQIRTKTQNVNDLDAQPYQMINPRFTLSGYNTEIKTAAGDLLIAPSLRVEANTNENEDAKQGKLAALRLGAFTALKTSTANTVSFFAATYANISDSTASSDIKNESHFYLTLGDEYQITEGNSISFSLEHFSNFNLETFRDANIPNQNELYLNYTNSQVKGLAINPYLLQNLGKTVALKNMALGLNLTYNL